MTMTSGVLQQQAKTPPTCYGLEWNRAAAECSGGADALYTHPNRGDHVRDQCPWFASCGARTQAMRSPPPIPVSQLVRPPNPVVPQSPGAYVEAHRQAAFPLPHLPPPQPPQMQPQYYAQRAPVNPQQQARAYELNYTIPAYLSTPEVREPGESIWSVAIREAIRAVFKALGHTVAHFFDANVLKQPPPSNKQ